MNFCTIADMQRDIVLNRYRLPQDIDAVVGIPRSGMLAASMIALALNRPLGDLDGFLQGRMLSSGSTRRTADLERGVESFRHVLIVDDSTRTGTAMVEAREKLGAAASDTRVTCAVVYGVPDMSASVDLCLRVIREPRVFEWNVMHHPILADACLDIDGVLCHDPDEMQNDDGARYVDFILNANPMHLPTRRIGTLVTSRLEKYRPQTEAWLSRQGLVYDRLVMLDLPDAATRRRLGSHGRFKGEYYRDSAAALFIESEQAQARQIAAISGKPVLSLEGMTMCMPDALSPIAALQTLRKPHPAKRLARWVLGDTGYTRLKRTLRGGNEAG